MLPVALTAAALAGCPLFPADFPTNQRVDHLPVAANSDAIVRSIGLDDHMHADFGSGRWEGRPIGIPYTVVTRKTKRSRVVFDYADESDKVGYPIPRRGLKIEGGSDRHALLVDRSRCRLYELYALRREGGRWSAGSGATWSLRRPRMRPAGWTSADAAGLPILPLLARYQEVRRGRITHALRMTVSESRRAFVFPARHFASSNSDPALPRMGERLRLKASTDISGLPPQARVVARAMKKYGLIVADNGSDWYVSGAPSPGWDHDQLKQLRRLRGSDFEVVQAPLGLVEADRRRRAAALDRGEDVACAASHDVGAGAADLAEIARARGRALGELDERGVAQHRADRAVLRRRPALAPRG